MRRGRKSPSLRWDHEEGRWVTPEEETRKFWRDIASVLFWGAVWGVVLAGVYALCTT